MANEKTKRYLIYLSRFESPNRRETVVYDYTGDVFHAMGEIEYRSEVEIYRMNFAEYSEEKVKFWNEQGVKIRKWYDKYKY